jgi:phospholipid/cholesterol/gamma-HCH transport system substrate-binding protein
MAHTNELKVGIALVVTVVIFFLGIRFLQNLPLFAGTYRLHTEFEDVGGLSAGNVVLMNGVRVGTVDGVSLTPDAQRVRVRFRVGQHARVPEGSHAEVTGMSLVGTVQMRIVPGPPGRPSVPPDGFLPGRSTDGLEQVLERMPMLTDQIERLLASAAVTADQAAAIMIDASGEMRTTFAAIRGAAHSMDLAIQQEQERLGRVMTHAEAVTGHLNRLTAEHADTLGQAVQNTQALLHRMNQNLSALEQTTATVDTLIARVERGEGTAGRLLQDESVYARLDSLLSQFNEIVRDFEEHPQRYLRHVRLISIF